MSYELQLIDCNCSNCKFMIRDLGTYKKWEDWHRAIDLDIFEKAKAKAIEDAEQVQDENNRRGMLRVANKMKFQFDKHGLIQYGDCEKLNKPVTFIPNVCQLETQECFKHRKDGV